MAVSFIPETESSGVNFVSDEEVAAEEPLPKLPDTFLERTGLATLGREAGMSVAPGLLAAVGGKVGFAGGAPLGPVGSLGGAATLSVLGGVTGDITQEAVLDAVAPEFARKIRLLREQGRAEHPYMGAAGRFLGALGVFRYGGGVTKEGIKSVPAVIRRTATPEQTAAAASATVQVGAGPLTTAISTPVTSYLMEGKARLPTVGEMAESTVQAALLGQPRIPGLRIGPRIGAGDAAPPSPAGTAEEPPFPFRYEAKAIGPVKIAEVNQKRGKVLVQRENEPDSPYVEVPLRNVTEMQWNPETKRYERKSNAIYGETEGLFRTVREQPGEGEGKVPAQEGSAEAAARSGEPAEAAAGEVPLTDITDDELGIRVIALANQIRERQATEQRWAGKGGLRKPPPSGELRTLTDQLRELQGEVNRRIAERQKPQEQPQEQPLSPDEEALIKQAQQEARNAGLPGEDITQMGPEDPNRPFAGIIARPSVDGKRIEINAAELRKWLNGIDPANRQRALNALMSEEGIHLLAREQITDAEAAGLWRGLTGPERALMLRAYRGTAKDVRFSDAQLGHEYLRRAMQRILRMDVRELADARGMEWLKQKAIDLIERVVISLRKMAGKNQDLDLFTALLEDSIATKRGRPVAGQGEAPAAFRRPGKGKGGEEEGQLRMLLTPMGEGETRPGLSETGAMITPALVQNEAMNILERAAGVRPTTTGRMKARPPGMTEEAWRTRTERAMERLELKRERGFKSLFGLKSFTDEMRKRFGDTLTSNQLRDQWQNSTWEFLMSRSGDDLRSIGKKYGLEVSDLPIADPPNVRPAQGELKEVATAAPRIRTRKYRPENPAAEERRMKLISQLGLRILEPAENLKPTVEPGDVNSYRSISKTEAASENIGKLLTEGGSMSRGGMRPANESVTRRVTALKNNKTGQVHLVSTYPTGAGEAYIVDPLKARSDRPNVPVDELLARKMISGEPLYEPIDSFLLDQPVKNFYESFRDAETYAKEFKEPSLAARQQRAGYTPPPETTEPEVYGARSDQPIGEGIPPAAPRPAPETGARELTLARDVAPTTVRPEQIPPETPPPVPPPPREGALRPPPEMLSPEDRAAVEARTQARAEAEAQEKYVIGETPRREQYPPGYKPRPETGIGLTPAAFNRRAISEAGAAPVRAFSEWMTERLARAGGPLSQALARAFNQGIQRQRELYGALTPTLDPALRAAGQNTRATREANVVNRVTANAGIDTGTQWLEGNLPVPAYAQAAVALWRRANLAIGQMLQPVARGVFIATGLKQRLLNGFGFDIIRRGEGPEWRAFVEGNAAANGVPVAGVEALFRRMKAVLDEPAVDAARLDAINQDFRRMLPRAITHIRISTGWEPVLHTAMFDYLQNAAQRAAAIRSFREIFPVGAGNLRPTVEGVRAELPGSEHRNFDALIRAMQGHPTDNFSWLGSALQPDQTAGAVFRAVNNTLGNFMAKLVLTGQMFVQPGEVIAGATPVFLGYRNYLRGMARLLRGGFYDMLEQRGSVSRVIYDDSMNPSSPIRAAFRRGGNVISRVFMETTLNELQEMGAAATAAVTSERIRAGTLSGWERRELPQTFKAMGFNPAEVQAMMNGDQRLLSQFEGKAASWLTSGNRAIAEGSRMGASRLANSIFRFQQYPMMKMNQLRKVWRNVTTAETPQARRAATEQLGRFLFGTALQGALTVGITSLFYEGKEGLKLRKEEAEDEPFKFAVESAIATMGGPFYNVWRGAKDRGMPGVSEGLARMAFPVTMINDMYDAAWGRGIYKDLEPWDRIAKFVQQKVPGTRAISQGMAAVGLSQDNKKLDADLKAFYKWKRDTFGPSEFGKEGDEERRGFRVAMKQAVEALKDGKEDDFYAALDRASEASEELPQRGKKRRKSKQSIASSFLARKVLMKAPGQQLTEEELVALRRRIGNEAVDRLERYDAMLEAAANGRFEVE